MCSSDLGLEAAPPLAAQEHHEWIACYEADPKTRTASPYQPEVTLKRGARLKAALTEIVRIGNESYYRVSECEAEPRAQDLYVRKSDCLETTPEKTPLYAVTRKNLFLYQVAGAGAAGNPIFQRARTKLAANTRLQISGVHKLGPSDPGNGEISDGKHRYYLITHCPGQSSAQGLFVRSNLVDKA